MTCATLPQERGIYPAGNPGKSQPIRQLYAEEADLRKIEY